MSIEFENIKLNTTFELPAKPFSTYSLERRSLSVVLLKLIGRTVDSDVLLTLNFIHANWDKLSWA